MWWDEKISFSNPSVGFLRLVREMRWLKIVIVCTCVCSCQKTIETKIIKSSNSWRIEVPYRRVQCSTIASNVDGNVCYFIWNPFGISFFYPTQPIIINWSMCVCAVQWAWCKCNFLLFRNNFKGFIQSNRRVCILYMLVFDASVIEIFYVCINNSTHTHTSLLSHTIQLIWMIHRWTPYFFNWIKFFA